MQRPSRARRRRTTGGRFALVQPSTRSFDTWCWSWKRFPDQRAAVPGERQRRERLLARIQAGFKRSLGGLLDVLGMIEFTLDSEPVAR